MVQIVDFREKGRERNIDVREKHQLVASHTSPDKDQARNLCMCPEWESDLKCFGVWDGTPTN